MGTVPGSQGDAKEVGKFPGKPGSSQALGTQELGTQELGWNVTGFLASGKRSGQGFRHLGASGHLTMCWSLSKCTTRAVHSPMGTRSGEAL